MRQIAIVGAGQAGLQLSFHLLQSGYEVTLISEYTAEEILSQKIMSSQGMFHTALQNERELGINFWEKDCPQNKSVSFTLTNSETNQKAVCWKGYVDNYFQAVDQRLKFSGWLNEFEKQGGNLIIKNADVSFLDELAQKNDLTLVATGKGEISKLFARDTEKSVFDKPMRSLACHYVKGMTPIQINPGVRVNIIPGVGEYFTMPGLTLNGSCEMMLFEGIPGGPFDCWKENETPEEQLDKSLELLNKYVPWEAERCQNVTLTDSNATLKGSYTPVIRKPIAKLPSGKTVLGMGDVAVLNDPIAGQGANNASKGAKIYAKRILQNEKKQFDESWMQKTFDDYWCQVQPATVWSNTLLIPPPIHVIELLKAASEYQELADKIANAFNDPSSLVPLIEKPHETNKLIEQIQRGSSQKVSVSKNLKELLI